MTQMELYLFAMGLVNALVGGWALGLARTLNQQKGGMDQAIANNLVEIETCIRLTQKSLLELHQIALRQEQRLADQETKIMGLMKRGEK